MATMYQCQSVISLGVYMLFENNDLFKNLMQDDEQYQKSQKEFAKFAKENPELAQAFSKSDESTSFICFDED